MNHGYVEGGVGVITRVIVADASYIATLPDAADWLELPYGVGTGWEFNGVAFVSPDGSEPGVPREALPRYILSGTEWVERFTEQEWTWLKVQRTTSDRLDQMMDSIRWTNSIDISSPNMDEFYNWLLNNGIPGGQARIDELRAGI
jgi:hypothetical protein